MKAVVVRALGEPEVLRYEDAPDPRPGPGQALVRVEAAGVNYIDVYYRKGLYETPLPYTPGFEAAGTILETGPDAGGFQPGDRVAYTGSLGSYAERAVVAVSRLVKIPGGLDSRQAAASMLQGMTAHYLVKSTYPLKRGEACLVHAAAGGVGLLLCQMAKRLGARVFATVSSEEKARLAREAGADETIDYSKQDFAAEVKSRSQGRGLQVVYDSVGRSTFDRSLECLAPRGMLVLFGQSSGPVPPVDLQLLNKKGSLFVTRPSLSHYTLTREELLWRAGEVLDEVRKGELKLRIGLELPLSQAAEAHRRLESRRTTGKILLLP